MKVRDILRVKGSTVHSIGPEDSVLDAVGVLLQYRIGALLVRDLAGTVCGIVSERDVLRECLHRGADLGRIPVREAMTADPVVCAPDDGIALAMELVTRHRVRHLPVLDAGQVAGLISIGDLVKASLDETAYENRCLKEYMHGR